MSCSFHFDPLCSCVFEQDETYGFNSLPLTNHVLKRHKITEEVSKTLLQATDSSYFLAYIPEFRVHDILHPFSKNNYWSKSKLGEEKIIDKSLSLIESYFKWSDDIAFLFKASLYSFFILLRKSNDGECTL